MIKLGRRSLGIAASLATLLLVLGANSAFGSSRHRGQHRQDSVDLIVQRALNGGPRAVKTLLQHRPSRAVLKALQWGLLKDRKIRWAGRHWVLGSGIPEARAASAGESCTLYVAYLKMVFPGNSRYAQALIGDYCSQPISGTVSTFGCGEIDEFQINDHQWHDKSYVCGPTVGADEWSWSYPSAFCQAPWTRNYRARGYGTASDNTGVWGFVTPWTYVNNLPCLS
jgi:hypothetical protein